MRPSSVLVIFGAMGDLTNRLLLPGLASMLAKPPQRTLKILGVDRASDAKPEFISRVDRAIPGGAGFSAYLGADVTDPASIQAVLDHVDETDQVVLYFALPPAITAAACHALQSVELPVNTHLAMEKPFGHDLNSARDLNEVVTSLVPGNRIHRVDHFLGKSTVLNVMALRFANRLFAQVWSAEHIESVVISYDEALALEGRAGYYDQAGALVDMIQSHLLQVMAVVAMEPPAQITDREVRDAKSAVLRATRLWGGAVEGATRRGQYTQGAIGNRQIPNYADEYGVDPERHTETMAQVTVEVANNRWAGVPFTLRSGKALGETKKQIVITFKDVNHLPGGLHSCDSQDRLILGLSPDIMELHLTTNRTEDAFTLEQSVFTTVLREAELAAYGEVLTSILNGEALLSVGAGAAEECWRIIDEILAEWKAGRSPMEYYPAGSSVPLEWAVTPLQT